MGYWNNHMTRKIAVGAVEPGMQVLYRLRWHEVVGYSAEQQAITLSRCGKQETLPLTPDVAVIVVDDDATEAD